MSSHYRQVLNWKQMRNRIHGASVVLLGAALFLLGSPVSGEAANIVVRLSGDLQYPGYFSLDVEGHHINHLCFLGSGAKGQVDRAFLKHLSQSGIPEGEYVVSPPLREEKWPSRSFVKNGALRLIPVSMQSQGVLAQYELNGIAVHGRDFYPLVVPLVKDKRMVRFYSDQLFDRLKSHWGPLRISNWDMGRLHDTWKRIQSAPDQLQARVEEVSAEQAKRLCQPPFTQRKPG